MTPTAPTSSAAGIAWNLQDLYTSVSDPAFDRDLGEALTRAEAFEHKYRSRIAALDASSAPYLDTAVRELEAIFERMDKPAVYASLVHAARTDVPSHGALLSKAREQRTAINKHLIFFDLEWIALADSVAHQLLQQPDLARYRHYLEQKRLWKPHYLSEGEEKILDEKATTGKAAFGRLFEETNAAMQFPFARDGQAKSLSLQEILAKLYDADRSVRQAAAAGISTGLRDNSRLLTFIFNTIVLDHDSDCRLRKYASPIASRNLANEITGEVVEALMQATERHYDLVQRYYRLKGKLLGLDKLYDYDRYAPLFPDAPACDWPTARRIVQESYDAFSPRAGAIIRQFFDKNWIDAELRTGQTRRRLRQQHHTQRASLHLAQLHRSPARCHDAGT